MITKQEKSQSSYYSHTKTIFTGVEYFFRQFFRYIGLKMTIFTRQKLKIQEMENNQNEGHEIQIELKEDVAQGTYSNLAIITHSPSEFVIDFVRIMPGVPKADVKSRIILTPEHAKRLLYALKDNIAKYEAVHGTIKNVDPVPPVIPMNFGGPTPQA